jgi:hypothetical protein
MVRSYGILACLLGLALAVGIGCGDDGTGGTGGTAATGGTGGTAATGGTGGTAATGGTGGTAATGGTGGTAATGGTGGTGGVAGTGGTGGVAGTGGTGGVGGTGGAACTVPAPVDAPGIPMACRNSFNQAVSTFPIDLLNVTPDDCILDGQPFNTAIDPVIALDTAFLEAAAQTLCDLGTLLTEADVTSAQVSVDAIAGATCTEQLSVLPGTPVTVTVATVCTGTCGDLGVTCEVTAGIALPLPAITVPCSAAGTAGSEVQFCSTGTVPLSISLSDPPPPPAYQETYVGVSVGGGAITVAFACNTSSTTVPAPGVVNEIGCILPNPTQSTPNGLSCGEEVGFGDTGETPFPESDCNTVDGPPIPDQTCDLFGTPITCSGTCDTVPVGVDPSTVCATFTVQ